MDYQIRHVAVIGAGTMGGGIAAHTANAGYSCSLLDIAPGKLTPEEEAKGLTLEDGAVRNRIVNNGFKSVVKSRPSALFSQTRAGFIRVGNLEDNIEWLKDADLIVEVVLEDLAIKHALFDKIMPYIKDTAIVTTNTSGIPIWEIVSKFDQSLKKRFLGTHFFNPPRWLKLLEIIPTDDTDPEAVDFMSKFGENIWGKGIVKCKDTPNFIANRMGAFDIMLTLDYAVNNGYTVEEVDAITGPLMGRPSTAMFKLNDLVGIDVNFHVLSNLYPAIPDDEDRELFNSQKVMDLMQAMVDKGRLGRKSGKGFYKMSKDAGGKKTFEVVDLASYEYRPQDKPGLPGLDEAGGIKPLSKRLRHLVDLDDKVGELAWAVVSRNIAYASKRVPEISDELFRIDQAMKWGYGHQMGPFEVWDALGVEASLNRMEAEGLNAAPWVKEMLEAGISSFYKEEAGKSYYYDVPEKAYKEIPVSGRITILKSLKDRNKTIKENASASLIDIGNQVACLEFHSKSNSLDDLVVEMISQAIPEVEKNFKGMVIGNQGARFSVGANIHNILLFAKEKRWEDIGNAVSAMHKAISSFRYCLRPVVAAPFDMTLGGGAEVCMGADKICATGDLFMGLVELGVGVVPAGGGCKELVRRVISPVMSMCPQTEPLPLLLHVFGIVSQARVTGSALEAMEWGFLDRADVIVMNSDHLIHQAKEMVLHMHAMEYVPPVPEKVYAMGARGFEALHVGIVGMGHSGFISEHDVTVATHLARILAGGEQFSPSWVNEQHFLDLEREAFVSLCGEPKTQARIEHMLKTNKPLRN